MLVVSELDLFERTLASLHEATLDDAYWPATSGLVDEVCESKGNFLVVGDGARQDDIEVFLAQFCFRGQRHTELERLYFEVYHALDERLPRIRQLPDGDCVHISSLYTEEEKKTSIVYNEALPLADTCDSLNVRLDGPQDSRIVLVVADPVGGDGWSRSNVVMVERLLPHLRQFAHVRQALVNARALGSSLAMLLENTRFGVIQLDRFGRIAAANDPAGALLREGDGLHDQYGRLRAAVPEEDDALQGLLARALPPFGGRAASGSMMVSRALVLPRLVVHVTPVKRVWADGGASRVRVLVLAVDPMHRAAVAPELVAATLGLTLAESHIAVSLAQGRTVRDIALATGRSAGTVRWHMKNIFAKCGISRQMELVQLVLSLADLPQTWP